MATQSFIREIRITKPSAIKNIDDFIAKKCFQTLNTNYCELYLKFESIMIFLKIKYL